MTYKKSTHEGREERLCVLRRYEPCISAFLSRVLSETLRKHLQADDVLDATVAFITSEATSGKLASLSGDPSHDLAGLPMEMLYLKTWGEAAYLGAAADGTAPVTLRTTYYFVPIFDWPPEPRPHYTR